MTTQTVTDTAALAAVFPQLAAIISDKDTPLPVLAEHYNTAAKALGEKAVNRFPDRVAAVKRTTAIFGKLANDDEAYKTWAGKQLIGDQKSSDAATFDSTTEATVPATDAPKGKGKKAPAVKAEKPAKEPKAAKAPAAPKEPKAPKDTSAIVKDDEMPVLRKGTKPVNLAPKAPLRARRAGSKQALLIDLLSRPDGATFGEIFDAMLATGKPWKGASIRSGLAWDTNAVAGYGIATEMLNGVEFANQGRWYEANRLGVSQNGVEAARNIAESYDPDLKLGVYRLTYPKGVTAPLPHTTKED